MARDWRRRVSMMGGSGGGSVEVVEVDLGESSEE